MALLIFTLTFLLIAGRRLRVLPIGRPAGALVGAAAMVASGVLSPAQAWAAVDPGTLGLLFAMMALGAYLDHDGVLESVELHLLGRAHSPLALLLALAVCAAALSAVLVNDTVCVLLTPLVVRWCVARGLPLVPYLLALSTSANLGSAATLVGNPQNMLIGGMSGLGFWEFTRDSMPAVLAALGVHLGLLVLFFGRSLPPTLPSALPAPRRPTRRTTAVVTLGVLVAFVAGGDLAWTALAGLALVVLLRREDPAPQLRQVDWSLLVFFAALFVVVAGAESTGLLDRVVTGVGAALVPDDAAGVAVLSAVVVLGSNLLSNVPLVMLLGPLLRDAMDTPLTWLVLAYTSTVAGNLTLLGSVANLIVAEAAREHHELGFWEYLRFGAATTLASLLVGVPLLVWAAG